MVLTNKALWNVKGQELQRSILLTHMSGLTKNIKRGGHEEFIVHVKDEYDYRLTSKCRENLFTHIKKSYLHLT